MDVVIVGAGVVGAALGFRLAAAGAHVTLFEAAERVGAGTSGRSFAWTNANDKPPRAYHDLNVAGMRAHAALADEFGGLPWWHGGGSVEWFATAAERDAQRAKIERLHAWGYAAEWLSPAQLHELEPDVDLASVGDAPIAYFPDEGWLDPILYLHAMLDAARGHGAQVRTGAQVARVEVAGGRATGVVLANGERCPADVVVNCAGRWADTLSVGDEPALRLPLAPTFGLLVFTPPVATCVRRIVRSAHVHLRPDGAGRLVLHMDDADATLTLATQPSPQLPIAQDLVQRVAAVLPSIGPVEPEAVRIGVRPIPADGLSAVGPLPGLRGYYVVVTHSGVTLSLILAHLAASELTRGTSEAQLEPFRPTRLLVPSRI